MEFCGPQGLHLAKKTCYAGTGIAMHFHSFLKIFWKDMPPDSLDASTLHTEILVLDLHLTTQILMAPTLP